MKFTEIIKWCDEHPDTYVDIHISLCKIIGETTIKLKMQKNHSKSIYRTSTDIENDFSRISATLDEMYENIEPMLNLWAEYVATYSYLTIEEAEKLYPLCKSINMQKEQAIALLQSKGDLELLYYTITHEGNKKKCTEICADPDLILDKQPKKAQWDRINKCTKKDEFICRWNK